MMKRPIGATTLFDYISDFSLIILQFCFQEVKLTIVTFPITGVLKRYQVKHYLVLQCQDHMFLNTVQKINMPRGRDKI